MCHQSTPDHTIVTSSERVIKKLSPSQPTAPRARPQPHRSCRRLDEAAEAQLRDDGDVQSDDGDEALAEESSEEEEAEDEESAARSARHAARSAAADLRQQSLQEVLVGREEARPDQAPAMRPRQPWVGRTAAWEAAQQAA